MHKAPDHQEFPKGECGDACGQANPQQSDDTDALIEGDYACFGVKPKAILISGVASGDIPKACPSEATPCLLAQVFMPTASQPG